MFMLGEDLEQLEAAIKAVGDVTLVTIDPITAFMGKVNSSSPTEVRNQLGPLAQLAERTEVAITTITHPPKQSSQRSIDHFIGTQAFISAARIGHVCLPEMKVQDGGLIRTGRNLFTQVTGNHQQMMSIAVASLVLLFAIYVSLVWPFIYLTAKGYIARGGQMVDATIVPVPKQRNTREENETVKRGETPVAWEEKPAKNRQKDKDARWTKKHGKSFFGYKNHVNADKTHKLIRDYEVTDAAVHDGRVLETLLDKANTGKDVFGDSAYRSAAAEEKLAARGFRSRICVRGTRGRPLSKAKAAANRAKSRIRARIEHVFGAQETAPGGRIVRTIGILRARLKIGLQNFVYNIRRLATLERMAAA